MFRTDEVIKKYKCTVGKVKFHSLLRIAHRRKETGESVDQFFIKHRYADDIRKLIAYSLYVIYEASILFRTELYKEYTEKSKSVKKMPETDVYYQDAQKLKVTIRGKQTKKDTIIKDAKDYRAYIRDTSSVSNRDRHFYEAKRFRYLTVLVVKINNFFKEEVKEPKNKVSSLQGNGKDTSSFSIDHYLNKAMNTQRPIYGVMLINLPSLKSSIKGSSR